MAPEHKPTDGYPVKDFGVPTKRIVQILSLHDKPELIEEYRRLHSEPHMWREIMDGIRQVGILEMELYILGNIEVMIVEVPEDFNWDEAMARLATLPRQAEWEATVGQFQQARAGATSDQKWHPMERMFYLYD